MGRLTFEQNGGAGTPADGQTSASPFTGGGTPVQGGDAQAQYAAYWAAYGYDVNDPQCTCSTVDEVEELILLVFFFSPSLASIAVCPDGSSNTGVMTERCHIRTASPVSYCSGVYPFMYKDASLSNLVSADLNDLCISPRHRSCVDVMTGGPGTPRLSQSTTLGPHYGIRFIR